MVSDKKIFFTFSLYKPMLNMWPLDGAIFGPRGNLNKLDRSPLGDATYQISRLQASWFQTRRFLKFSSRKSIFKPLWPRYATDQNYLNNFGRGPPKDHLCEIISQLDQGFRRCCHLSQLLTDDGQSTKIDHKSSPCHYVTGKLTKTLKCLTERWNDRQAEKSIPHPYITFAGV